MELVNRIIAGGDQVLNRLWEGLVLPDKTLEGLQTHKERWSREKNQGKVLKYAQKLLKEMRNQVEVFNLPAVSQPPSRLSVAL